MRTFKNLLTILCLFIYCFVVSQANINWEFSFGGSGDDQAYHNIQTSDDGYLLTGWTTSNDGDVAENQGIRDVWVAKLNSSGEMEWQNSFGGSSFDGAGKAIQTADGGYMIIGYTMSNDGDITSNKGMVDYWLLKLSSMGELEWEKTYGGSGNDFGTCIIQTSDGGFIIGGNAESTDGDVSGNKGGADYWIAKINTTGDIQWEKSFGGSANEGLANILQTEDNGYMLAGATFSFDGDVSQNAGDFDIWIVKIDEIGTLEWEKSYGTELTDSGNNIISTPDGGFLLTGYYAVESQSANWNYIVLKIDNNGAIEWEKSLGGSLYEWASAASVVNEGGYVISGFTESFDGDVSANNGGKDFWIVKLDNSGEIEWDQNFGGTNNEEATSIIQSNDGSFTVTGFSNSNDLDVSANKGSNDFWIVNFNYENLSTSDLISNNNIKIVPNPADNIVLISSDEKILSVEIFNLIGQKLRNKLTTINYDKQNATIDVSNLSEGTYLVKVTTENTIKTMKLIVK